MTKFAKIAAVAVVALGGFAFASVASAVSASSIYSPATGFLRVGSGMGAKAYQAPQVMAAQEALNACMPGMDIAKDGKFGPMTETKFKAFQASKMIAQDGIIGPITAAQLAACSGDNTSTPSTPSTGLQGGAGDLEDVDILSTYSGEDVMEGANDAKVMAFEIEADNGSDLMIQNVRLNFEHTGAGSTRMNKYIDSVKVWMGNKEVGSANEDDFSENSDVYSKSISLNNAIVEDGEKETFYVSVDAISNIDSNDQNEDWDVTLESIRFVDAAGAVITDSATGELGNSVSFSFEDLQTSGDLEAKLSKGSNSPEAQVVEVDSTSDTNDVTLLEFKIKATGSDMTIDNMQFSVTPTGANANEIVKEFKLIMDGEEIDSIDAPSIASTVTDQINFTDLEDEVSIDEGDTMTFKVVADINDLEGAFGNGDSILVSYTNADFTDTTCAAGVDCTVIDDVEGDTVVAGDRTGSAIGEVQTFFEEGIMVKLVGTPTATVVPGDAVGTESDSGTFVITFDVTAFGNDIYVDKTAPTTAGGATESDIDVTGTGTVTAVITSPTGADEGTDGFLVEEGTTERFSITTNILATASGFFQVKLGSILYALTDVDGDTVYNSNLEDFKTANIYLIDR